jgi:hypothetical protein
MLIWNVYPGIFLRRNITAINWRELSPDTIIHITRARAHTHIYIYQTWAALKQRYLNSLSLMGDSRNAHYILLMSSLWNCATRDGKERQHINEWTPHNAKVFKELYANLKFKFLEMTVTNQNYKNKYKQIKFRECWLTSTPKYFVFSCANKITDSMKFRTIREATSCVTTLEFPRILCNPKILYHFHKSQSFVPLLRQIQSLHPILSLKDSSRHNHPTTSWSS